MNCNEWREADKIYMELSTGKKFEVLPIDMMYVLSKYDLEPLTEMEKLANSDSKRISQALLSDVIGLIKAISCTITIHPKLVPNESEENENCYWFDRLSQTEKTEVIKYTLEGLKISITEFQEVSPFR